MSVVTRIASPREDLVSYDFAAEVCAFLVIHGCIDFSDASAAIARAGIRAGWVDQRFSRFDDMRERLERRIGMAILTFEAEAAAEIRKAVSACKGSGKDEAFTANVVETINRLHNHVLPERCVEFLLAEARTRG